MKDIGLPVLQVPTSCPPPQGFKFSSIQLRYLSTLARRYKTLACTPTFWSLWPSIRSCALVAFAGMVSRLHIETNKTAYVLVRSQSFSPSWWVNPDLSVISFIFSDFLRLSYSTYPNLRFWTCIVGTESCQIAIFLGYTDGLKMWMFLKIISRLSSLFWGVWGSITNKYRIIHT